MQFTVDNNTMPDYEYITFGGNRVSKIVYNGGTVWKAGKTICICVLDDKTVVHYTGDICYETDLSGIYVYYDVYVNGTSIGSLTKDITRFEYSTALADNDSIEIKLKYTYNGFTFEETLANRNITVSDIGTEIKFRWRKNNIIYPQNVNFDNWQMYGGNNGIYLRSYVDSMQFRAYVDIVTYAIFYEVDEYGNWDYNFRAEYAWPWNPAGYNMTDTGQSGDLNKVWRSPDSYNDRFANTTLTIFTNKGRYSKVASDDIQLPGYNVWAHYSDTLTGVDAYVITLSEMP